MKISLLAFGAAITLSAIACADHDHPNLVIIMTDDQGYADVGFNGCEDIPTPNIDRIAHEGVRFTNGYVTYSVCSPSRAGLITGRYQGRFGYRRNPTLNPFDENAGLPLEEENMAEILKKINYHTGYVGKWHLGTHPKFRPNARGFDEFYGFESGGHRYFPEDLTYQRIEDVDRKGAWYNTKLLRNDRRVETDEYLTDEFSHEAVDFINKNREKPFLLFLSYNAPHTPMQASQKYLDRFTHIENKLRRTYAAMVSAVDDGVGRVLDTLRKPAWKRILWCFSFRTMVARVTTVRSTVHFETAKAPSTKGANACLLLFDGPEPFHPEATITSRLVLWIYWVPLPV